MNIDEIKAHLNDLANGQDADFANAAQFLLQVVGFILVCISLLTLAVRYLP